MSYAGNLTPLELNIKGALLSNSGLTISTVATAYQGTWLPTSYTSGSVTNSTALQSLTTSLPRFYQQMDSGTFSLTVYRNLLRIGSGHCAALGNSRPSTFVPSYAGYGTWKRGTVDSFGNFVSNPLGSLSLVDRVYPPEGYPTSTANSYIQNNYGKLAWISAWPDRASWQATTDNYRAVLEPATTDPKGDYEDYFKYGFVATIARQAYYEFWYNYATRRVNQYSEFIKFFQTAVEYKNTQNINIGTFQNSKTYLSGNYSNINDLTSSDVSGVSLAFKDFGNECIALGKAVDLSQIHKFGMPSVLLRTLQNCNALTEALRLALLLSELTVTEISSILESDYIPTAEQERKIYQAFISITEDDLRAICTIINCTTPNLRSLADLLEPRKMFPTTFPSLTVPRYSIDTASNKIYDFIYDGEDVNPRINNWGDYLVGIIPSPLFVACGAFMMSMNQIKNIRSMNFERFAQVVANLESTDKDLPLVAAINPSDSSLTNSVVSKIALGSGNSGSYRLCDFVGSMSGYPYSDYYSRVIDLLQSVDTTRLSVIYRKLEQKSLFNNWALISRGSGWNPASTWAPEYAYTLFVTSGATVSFSTSVTIPGNLVNILTVGTQISFSNTGATVHTVSSVTYSGSVTTMVFAPAITQTLPTGSPVYIYENIYDSPVQNLIDAANAEIQKLATENSTTISQLNHYWDAIGSQLLCEQRAIPYAVPTNENIYGERTRTEFDTFVSALSTYAEDTTYCGASSILESICDINTLGGQSIIAALRDSRNTVRLHNTFGDSDATVPSELNEQQASAVISAVDSAGGITEITVTFGGFGYSAEDPPCVVIGPYGGAFGGSGYGCNAVAVVDAGRVIAINIIESGTEYEDPNVVGQRPVYIDPPPQPQRLGDATEPGSFAGSPYTGQDPIPDNLIAPNSASYTVAEAIDKVTRCNCDCWNL